MAQSQQIFTDVPACAVSCLNDAFATSGCAVNDAACICDYADLPSSQVAGQCLIMACSGDDLTKLIDSINAGCAGVRTTTTSTPTTTTTRSSGGSTSFPIPTSSSSQRETQPSSKSSSSHPTIPQTQPTPSTTGATAGDASSGDPSAGAKAGIAVAGVVVVALAATFWIFLWRRKKTREPTIPAAVAALPPYGGGGTAELDPENRAAASVSPAELGNDGMLRQELSDSTRSPLRTDEKPELLVAAAAAAAAAGVPGGVKHDDNLNNKQPMTTTPGPLSNPNIPVVSELPIDSPQPMPPELYTPTPQMPASQIPSASELYSSSTYQYQHQGPSPGTTAESQIPGNTPSMFPSQNSNPPPPTWDATPSFSATPPPPPPTNTTNQPMSIEQREAQDELEQLLRQEAELERRRRTLVELRSIEEEQAALRERIKAAQAQIQ